jgi:hypothetical protein
LSTKRTKMSVTRQNKVGYGLSEPLPGIPQDAIVAVRNPTGRDRAPLGQVWVNTTDDAFFILTSIVSGVSNWTNGAGGAGVFSSLNVQPGPTFISSTTVDILGTDAVVDAVNIAAQAGAGGVRIASGTNGIGLNSTGAVDIDGLAPSHFAVTGGSLTLSSNTSVTVDGGLQLNLASSGDNGNINIDAGVVNAAGAAALLNSYVGIATLTGLTTGAAATEVVTITCDKAIVTSGVICSATNFGANDAQMTVTRIENFAGSFVVTLQNFGTQALNGDLVLSFIVLN